MDNMDNTSLNRIASRGVLDLLPLVLCGCEGSLSPDRIRSIVKRRFNPTIILLLGLRLVRFLVFLGTPLNIFHCPRQLALARNLAHAQGYPSAFLIDLKDLH